METMSDQPRIDQSANRMNVVNKAKEHLQVAYSTADADDDNENVKRFSVKTVLGSLEQKINQGYLIQVNSNELSDDNSINFDTLRKLKDDKESP